MRYLSLNEFIVLVVVTALVLLGALYIVGRVFGVAVYIEPVQQSRAARMAAKKLTDEIIAQEKKELRRIARQAVERANRNFDETLNELQDQVKGALDNAIKVELWAYNRAAKDVQTQAKGMIQEALDVAAQQQADFLQNIEDRIEAKKNVVLTNVEENISDIIRIYVDNTLRHHVTADDQIDVLLAELEELKPEILRDIKHGT